MKNSLLLALAFALNPFAAQAAPNTYISYSCSQGCGLTAQPEMNVRAQSLSRYDALSALSDFCSHRNLRLQGTPSCAESRYDYTNSERFQRCRQGISPLGSCMVSVYGYGASDVYQRSFQQFSPASFDDAESKAMAQCRAAVGYGSCTVAAYSAY